MTKGNIKETDIDLDSISDEDLINGIIDIQKVTGAKIKKGGKFNASITIIDRHLRQAILHVTRIGDLKRINESIQQEDSGQSNGLKIGDVRHYKKPEKQPESLEKPLKIGEVRNKQAIKMTDDERENEDIEFIKHLAGLEVGDFKAKFNNLNQLKTIGKSINDLEGEKIITLGGKGVGVENIQEQILKFLHETPENTEGKKGSQKQEETTGDGKGKKGTQEKS